MQNTDYFKSDLTRLHNLGVNLINAMQVEQFPAEMKAHFTNTLKKDFTAFKQDLPVFSHSTRAWYSEAQLLISQYLPGRLADFGCIISESHTANHALKYVPNWRKVQPSIYKNIPLNKE